MCMDVWSKLLSYSAGNAVPLAWSVSMSTKETAERFARKSPRAVIRIELHARDIWSKLDFIIKYEIPNACKLKQLSNSNRLQQHMLARTASVHTCSGQRSLTVMLHVTTLKVSTRLACLLLTLSVTTPSQSVTTACTHFHNRSLFHNPPSIPHSPPVAKHAMCSCSPRLDADATFRGLRFTLALRGSHDSHDLNVRFPKRCMQL